MKMNKVYIALAVTVLIVSRIFVAAVLTGTI